MNGFNVNRLTRVLLTALVISLLACMCLLVTACQHEHEYESEVTVEAMCNKVGKMTYRCTKCDNSYSVELPMTEHSYTYGSSDDEHWQACAVCSEQTTHVAHEYTEIVSSEPSTCQEHGSVTKKCVCGSTNDEELPLAQHSFTVVKHNVDNHWLECSVCNEATSDVQSHKFETVKIVKQSTCTTYGSKGISCSCGETKTEELPLIPHAYTKVKFDDDAHWSVCSMCDAEQPDQSVTAHEFSVVTVEPECEKSGNITTTCIGCNYKTV